MKEVTVRPGVFYASVQGEGVVMDLLADRYYGLSAEASEIWSGLLSTDTDPAHGTDEPSVPASSYGTEVTARAIADWLDAGLVETSASEPPGLPRPLGTRPPAIEAIDEHRVRETRLSLGMLRRITWSSRLCRREMHRQGLASILRRIQVIEVDAESPDDQKLVSLVRAYHALRRVRSQGLDDCLPRSLAFAHASRTLGFDARVCFGVRKFPFLAHAWVEVGDRVANERPQLLSVLTVLARF